MCFVNLLAVVTCSLLGCAVGQSILGEPWLLLPPVEQKKKKLNIVSCTVSLHFSLMSLSRTHINTYMRILSLRLVYSFYCPVCLSTGCLLAIVDDDGVDAETFLPK